jgi:hypothetical protein
VTKGLRKIRGLKRPKMKNLKLSRTYKSLRDAAKKRSRNFKGKVIKGEHELYTLTAGMMLGMRCSIGNVTNTSRHDLTLTDFSYVEKINFPPEGNTNPPFKTPPHSLAHTFKFKTCNAFLFIFSIIVIKYYYNFRDNFLNLSFIFIVNMQYTDAPRVFRRIRDFFNIDRTNYMLSVCGNYIIDHL